MSALPTDLIGDPGRIRQVLGHLVSNAVGSAAVGRVQIAAELVDQSPARAIICFGVRRPSPLTPTELDDILSPSGRGDESEARAEGLGLVVASKVIEALGGRLAVTENTASGTLLEFTLRSTVPCPRTRLQKCRPTTRGSSWSRRTTPTARNWSKAPESGDSSRRSTSLWRWQPRPSADRKACLDAGMNEHFTKPFRIEELQVSMERITRS